MNTRNADPRNAATMATTQSNHNNNTLQQSNNTQQSTSIATDLKEIVRTEMRKIVQVTDGVCSCCVTDT